MGGAAYPRDLDLIYKFLVLKIGYDLCRWHDIVADAGYNRLPLIECAGSELNKRNIDNTLGKVVGRDLGNIAYLHKEVVHNTCVHCL